MVSEDGQVARPRPQSQCLEAELLPSGTWSAGKSNSFSFPLLG